MLKLTTRCVAALLALSIMGCSQYLDRRDTMLLGAGEAVQTNIVTHQIDPWPTYARNVYAETSGERLQRAVERYRSPQQGGGAATPAPASTTLGGTVPTR